MLSARLLMVEDMEKALKYWTEYLKAGPFFYAGACSYGKSKIPKRPLKCRCFHRAGQPGDVQIELIHCENDAPSGLQRIL